MRSMKETGKIAIDSRARVLCVIALTTGFALFAATSIGCTAPKWIRGEGLTGPNAELGNGLRPKEKNLPQGAGIDERAREIERHLGFQ